MTSDINRMEKDLVKIKKLREANNEALKNFGIDIKNFSLPSDVRSTLQEFINLKRELRLKELDRDSLQLWYFQRKKEIIDLSTIVTPMAVSINAKKKAIAKEEQEIRDLESCIASFESSTKSSGATEKSKLILEDDIAKVESSADKLQKIPDHLHIDDIIEKVEQLQARK